MDKIRINYSKFDLKNGGKGVIAVLMYSGSGDPKIALDNAVLKLRNPPLFWTGCKYTNSDLILHRYSSNGSELCWRATHQG